MRKIPLLPVIISATLLIAAAGATLFLVRPKKSGTHSPTEQETVFHCPMHPNYLSHQAGNCPVCGMKLVPVNEVNGSPDKKANKKKRILFYRDAMNPSYTSDNPGKAPDGMDLVPVYEGEDGDSGIRIDPAMIQSIGVQTEKAAVRTLTRDIRTSAVIMPDERRISSITTKVMGYVEKMYVNYTGQIVKKGQPLYDLYSPDLINAQAEYLQNFQNSAPNDSGQLLRSARQRLINWDVDEEQVTALEKRGSPEKTLTFVSPVNGVVAEKMIVEGQAIEPGMQMYKVIDYSRVWVEGAVYQQDVPLVKIGQHADIELDYYPGGRFTGKVTFISPELDRESRTLMIRLDLANTPDISIKPGMNASVVFHAEICRNSITVPEQAVLRSGLRTLVVIAKGGGYFNSREIRAGQTAGGYTEVIEGVQEGEEIVVSSQFLIDSESNLKTAVMKMAGKGVRSGSASGENRPAQVSAMTDEQSMNDSEYDTKAPVEKFVNSVYRCPMHPEIISDKPGSCPKCGMNLTLQEAESDNAAENH